MKLKIKEIFCDGYWSAIVIDQNKVNNKMLYIRRSKDRYKAFNDAYLFYETKRLKLRIV